MSTEDNGADNPVTREPYVVPRNLDQDAWFLYETSSIPYYEQCARLCEEFAHFFNRLITGHDARGMGKVDYWVSRYLTHAENIRRGIELIRMGGDYYPMHDFLRSPVSDWRGLIENAFGCEVRDEWQPVFQPLSCACGIGSETLRNAYQDNGLHWLDRANIPDERRYLVDRDDSHKGDTASAIGYAVEDKVLNPPAVFTRHPIDKSITAKPGDRCPRTGVWAPRQWIDERAGDFSLAFCLEGRPMQPAYQIEIEVSNGSDDPEFPFIRRDKVTHAVDTTWYYVHKPDVAAMHAQASKPLRLRCEANQPCPREGWWVTPAKLGSRRHFKQGEVMPAFKTDWGLTIWQWDDNNQST